MDIKILSDLANKFDQYANNQISIAARFRSPRQTANYNLKAKVWTEAAKELREAIAIENLPPVDIDGLREAWNKASRPAVTNNEIVGIVAASLINFKIWASNNIVESGGIAKMSANRGSLELPNGKRYVYITGVEQLRSLELSSYIALPTAYSRSDYEAIMSILPSRVRRQVTK